MTTTTQMISIIGIMLAINISLVLFQNGITEINPYSDSFFNVTNSPYSGYIDGNELNVNESYIPDYESDEAESGNIFTDTFNSMKSWFMEKLQPLSFVGSVLKQPYGFLKDINLPDELCLAFGTLWYLLALIIIVSWWGGR